jgi:CRISPR-associated protein Cas1
MLTEPKFMHSKIVVVMAGNSEKLSFKNDNLIVTDRDDNIKLQCSCYKIFAVFVVGGMSITTGIIERSKRFGFSIVFFSAGFRVYQTINFRTEGNTLLRQKQYSTPYSLAIAQSIISNKIENQVEMLKKLREKDSEGISILKRNLTQVSEAKDIQTAMGFEGVCAKAYFNRIFEEFDWKGRKPRIKHDPTNLLCVIWLNPLGPLLIILSAKC